jgi:hypothetical protein
MRTWPLVLMLILGCGGGGDAEKETPEAQAERSSFAAEAKAATNAYQLELKSALQSALQEGGAVHAISVCNTRAPEIAEEVSREEDLVVRRVSHRNRNPDNEPTQAELEVLHWFEEHPAAADTVMQVGGSEVYMRAIRVRVELCLRCHGDRDALAPELRETLAELYPQDEATGFSMGDLRGAFVVEKPSAGR